MRHAAPRDPVLAVPRHARAALRALAFAALLLAPACASSGYRYHFEPQPTVVQVHTSQGTFDLLLVSVLGATRPEGGDIDEMQLRFRLQNSTQQPLRLPVDELGLLSGDLLDYGAARLVGGSVEAAPGESAVADIGFALPEAGSPDLRGLTLHWVLQVEGKDLDGTATFQRVLPPSAYDPYGPWGPYWGPWGPPSWGWGHAGWHHVH